jgi:hypothetical protein
VIGSLHGPELLDRSVARDLTALSERGTSALRHYGRSGEALGGGLSVHLQAFRTPPTLVLVGAIDYSAAVAALASAAGYEVVIADAREAFARSERFSRVATVHIGWPAPAIEERELGPRDGVIVFSHDPKFDEPAIVAALRSDAGYIGALGSRRTARNAGPAPRGGSRSAGARPRALPLRARHRRGDARGGRDLDHGGGDRGKIRARRRGPDHDGEHDPPALSASCSTVSISASLPSPSHSTSATATPPSSCRAPSSPRSPATSAKELPARAAPDGLAAR